MQLVDAIEQVRDSVVQVTYTITGLTHARLQALGARGAVFSKPLGTGFVISNLGYVVTAKHVIDAALQFRADVPEGNHIVGAGFAHPNIEGPTSSRSRTFRVIQYDVVGCDDRNDLGLLHLQTNPFAMQPEQLQSREASAGLQPGVAKLQIDRPRDGTPIVVPGYPLGEPALVSTAGIIASAWSVDMRGTLVSNGHGDYAPADVADRYLADVQANGGNSGGAAYDTGDGAVLGMLVATRLTSIVGDDRLRTSANLAVLIPSRYVAELAERHGVVWSTAD